MNGVVIAIWYLIITSGNESGFIKVPEPTEQACRAEAALVEKSSDFPNVRHAFCVKGMR